MNKNGTFRISSWIAFSSNQKHRTFNRKIAFADWYGYVDCTEKSEEISKKFKAFKAFKAFIVVKDLNYKQNQTELFKIAKIKCEFNEARQKEDYDGFMDRMLNYEESILENGPSPLTPQRPSRSVDEKRSETVEKKKARSRSRQSKIRNKTNNSAPRPNLDDAMASLNVVDQQILPLHTDIEARIFAPIAPSTSPFISTIPSFNQDRAIVMNQESENTFIVWLIDLKQAALLKRETLGNVRIGTMYECHYISIPETKRTIYEVVQVVQRLEFLPFQMYQLNEETVAGVHVDLCSPNTNFQNWSFYMGTPFMNSVELGIVTMADNIDTPVEENQQWQKALRNYLGNRNSQKMLCYCRLVHQRVPQKLFDDFENDEFKSVVRYMWQVIRIYTSQQINEIREYNLIQDNMRERANQFKEEDDIAREKRQARPMVRFQ